MKIIKSIECAVLVVILAGCSTPEGKRDFVKHKQVKGNILGPYLYADVISPSEINVIEKKNGVSRRLTLELRGVKNTPDEKFNALATQNLHKALYQNTKGFYVIKDSAVYPAENRIRGVVLKGQQGFANHNIDSGETEYSITLYMVLQSDGLLLGRNLIDEDDIDFGWEKDFQYFQNIGQQKSYGFWANKSQMTETKSEPEP